MFLYKWNALVSVRDFLRARSYGGGGDGGGGEGGGGEGGGGPGDGGLGGGGLGDGGGGDGEGGDCEGNGGKVSGNKQLREISNNNFVTVEKRHLRGVIIGLCSQKHACIEH